MVLVYSYEIQNKYTQIYEKNGNIKGEGLGSGRNFVHARKDERARIRRWSSCNFFPENNNIYRELMISLM